MGEVAAGIEILPSEAEAVVPAEVEYNKVWLHIYIIPKPLRLYLLKNLRL